MSQTITTELSQKIKNMSFICSIFVVIIHVWAPKIGSPAWWFFSLTSVRCIAVPWFFLASGYFLAGHVEDSNWWRVENQKRIRTLIVPYVLWTLLWFIYICITTISTNLMQGQPVFAHMPEIDETFLGINPFTNPLLGTLWYVRTLLIFIFISPLLVFVLKRWCLVVLLLAFLKGFLFFGEESGTWGYFFERFLGASFLIYFLLGAAIRLKLILIPRFKNEILKLGLACFLLWCVLIALQVVGGSCFWIRVARRLIFHTSTAAMLYFIWRIMPTNRWPDLLTSSAFPIYLLHWFVLDFYAKIFYSAPQTIMQVVARMGFGIIVSLVLSVSARLVFPKASALLFGGR